MGCYAYEVILTFGFSFCFICAVYNSGPAEVGVQGVPGHTQYLALHLVKIKVCPEKFGVRYPMLGIFRRPCDKVLPVMIIVGLVQNFSHGIITGFHGISVGQWWQSSYMKCGLC